MIDQPGKIEINVAEIATDSGVTGFVIRGKTKNITSITITTTGGPVHLDELAFSPWPNAKLILSHDSPITTHRPAESFGPRPDDQPEPTETFFWRPNPPVRWTEGDDEDTP